MIKSSKGQMSNAIVNSLPVFSKQGLTRITSYCFLLTDFLILSHLFSMTKDEQSFSLKR